MLQVKNFSISRGLRSNNYNLRPVEQEKREKREKRGKTAASCGRQIPRERNGRQAVKTKELWPGEGKGRGAQTQTAN